MTTRVVGPPDSALDGLIVLEIATGIASALAGRMMAGFGAEVIKIEPPDGDPLRGAGPFPTGRVDLESSAAFLYFHGGKESVVLDRVTEAARACLTDLVAEADVILIDVPLRDRAYLGLTEVELVEWAPRAVVVSVSPYGETGPHSEYSATALTAAAAGGQMSLMGERDREPLKAYGNQAEAQASFSVFGSAMTGLLRRARTGTGSYVELSIQELQASAMDIQGPMAYNNDPPHKGLGHRNGSGNLATWSLYACRDGYVGIHVNPSNNSSFLAAIGRPDLKDLMKDRSFVRNELRPIVEAWCAQRTQDEVFQAAVQFGAPFSYPTTPTDLLESTAVAHTDIWREVAHPIAGEFRVPGPPFRSESPFHLARAPLLGEHTAQVLARLTARGDDAVAALTGQAARGRSA